MPLPPNIQLAIEAFSRLPGIGSKTAERLAFHLLRKPEQEVRQIGQAIASVKQGVLQCRICSHLTQDELCHICIREDRDKELICVVEGPLDLLALEKAGQFKGVYHVLHGVISPIEGIGPDELTFAELIERIKAQPPREIIMALNPSVEGEATMAYLMRFLQPLGIKVTALARGIPMGGHLEYADQQTLRRALEGRMAY